MILIKKLKQFLERSDRQIALFLLSPYSLKDIKNKKAEGAIFDFARKLRSYLQDLSELSDRIMGGAISYKEAEKILKRINNEIVEAGADTTHTINSKIISKKVKQRFREMVGIYAYQSNFVKRAYDKPRGYPGDYRTIELVYNNRPVSEGIGRYFDKYFLGNEYAIAVRNRKDKIKQMLKDAISNSDKGTINILNIACGSCREIKELFQDDKYPHKNIQFTLIDQDEEALSYSRKILSHLPGNIRLTLLRENVYDFIKDDIVDKSYSKKSGCYDLIYTIGLADYLPDRALENLIKYCFTLLLPKGKMILAHKNIDKYKPLLPDWFCDWTFYPRTQTGLIELVKSRADIQDRDIIVDKEESGIIFFLTLGKP